MMATLFPTAAASPRFGLGRESYTDAEVAPRSITLAPVNRSIEVVKPEAFAVSGSDPSQSDEKMALQGYTR